MPTGTTSDAAGPPPRRLYVYNGGFLAGGTGRRIKRILALAGFEVALGAPGADDWIGVWGQSPTSPRGEKVAGWTGAPVLRVEDAFLRSVLPGREGQPPLGLHLDTRGVHFDPAQPSDLERILADEPLDDTAVLNRAKAAMARLKRADLSKYNAFDPDLQVPEPGYVLVIDQTHGDASVRASRADRNTFLEMLFLAREEHPTARIVIKTHPETQRGHRDGHFRDGDLSDGVTFCAGPVSPHALLDGAVAVYTVSSQMGFEAITAGHRPVVLGQPFYVGWGLTDDRMPVDRRQRSLTRAQLFAGAMILYPTWYCPYRDRLATLEETIDTLEAEVRAWRDDRFGWDAVHMRLWKRSTLQKVFGLYAPMRFRKGPPPLPGRPLMVWAGKATPALDAAGAVRVEDGFLRSRGLGADLVPPLSLVLDDLGIYYDATRASRLEAILNASGTLADDARDRAERLIATLLKARLTKYNIGGDVPEGLPAGRRILVPGQVEDDASIRLGAPEVRTNAALLTATRAANPAAVILYKPHPDVEAGLRPGLVADTAAADAVLTRTDAVAALAAVDEVWTMTSLIGFEALLRGKSVTCLGQPFYAGWGLTEDRAAPLARRTATLDLTALAHGTLIAYPRYHDPVTGRPCPPEIVGLRLATGTVPQPSRRNRALAKLQGALAGFAPLWRR